MLLHKAALERVPYHSGALLSEYEEIFRSWCPHLRPPTARIRIEFVNIALKKTERMIFQSVTPVTLVARAIMAVI